MDRLSRVACLSVPHFVAATAERSEPPLRDRPLAVIDGVSPATRIVDANAAAREQGVRGAMVEAEARARCPSLITRRSAPEEVAAARQALLDVSLTISPRIEDAAAGLVYVDLGGLTGLLGDEEATGRRLTRVAAKVGFVARVAVAGSRIAARVAAARAGGGVTVIAHGDDRAALASAPLAVLGLSDDLVATLGQWGVGTLGDLAALPRAGIADRLGAAGLRAHDLASGVDRQPFRCYTPPPFWQEVQGLEWEIDTLVLLNVALAGVLDRLCLRLRAAHVATDALALQLELASGARYDRAIPLAMPMSDVKPIQALLRLALENNPPPAAVTRIALSAHAVVAQSSAGHLWAPAAPASRDLAAVLARLATLAGAENVGSAALGDSHRPDGFSMGPFAPPTEPTIAPAETTRAVPTLPDVAPMALRRLRPPRPVAVHTERSLVGDLVRPVSVRFDPHRARAVVAFAGPWRLSGEWWSERPWARDEWDLALADGTLCRVGHDRLTGAWYLDGVYD